MNKMADVSNLFNYNLLDKFDIYDLETGRNLSENPHQFSSYGILNCRGELSKVDTLRLLLTGSYGIRDWIPIVIDDLKECCKMSNLYHAKKISFSDWESFILQNKKKFDNPDFLQVLVLPPLREIKANDAFDPNSSKACDVVRFYVDKYKDNPLEFITAMKIEMFLSCYGSGADRCVRP